MGATLRGIVGVDFYHLAFLGEILVGSFWHFRFGCASLEAFVHARQNNNRSNKETRVVRETRGRQKKETRAAGDRGDTTVGRHHKKLWQTRLFQQD